MPAPECPRTGPPFRDAPESDTVPDVRAIVA